MFKKTKYMVVCCYFGSEEKVIDFYDHKPENLIEKLKLKAKSYDKLANGIVLWF